MTAPIDEESERWVTAVHEAGHVIAAHGLAVAVLKAWVDPDGDTGVTRLTDGATGLAAAVIAVAGEQATRLICGVGGGSGTDYAHADTALADHNRYRTHPLSLDRVEDHVTACLAADRPDLLRTARQLYRTGGYR